MTKEGSAPGRRASVQACASPADKRRNDRLLQLPAGLWPPQSESGAPPPKQAKHRPNREVSQVPLRDFRRSTGFLWRFYLEY